jgi:hypothetical protein
MRDISKLIYTGGYIITTIFGYILSTEGGDIVAGLNSGANLSQECDSRCFNYFAVYRVSFALVVYHSLLSILLLGCKDTSTKQVLIHTRHWPAKAFLWLLCFFGSFFIPSSFYAPYWIAAIVLSSFFICVQSLQLVDFACDIAESWISKYDTSGNTLRFKILLISSSSLCYFFALLLVSILYTYYATCQINQAVISLNLIAILGISLLSITPRIQERNPRFGLLQAAFISLYGTCLVSSAIAANDITFCTTFFTSSASDPAYQSSLDIAMKYVGLAFTFLSLGYSAFSTGTTNISGDEEEKVSYSFFHFIFALGSFYMAGLLTQWIEVSYMPNLGYVFTKGATSYWIKIATSGVCYLLYSWVLLAPLIFPNRF